MPHLGVTTVSKKEIAFNYFDDNRTALNYKNSILCSVMQWEFTA